MVTTLQAKSISINITTRQAMDRQWFLVALLFIVSIVNYFDRQSLSVVAPRLQAEIHLSDQGYGHIVSLFLFASALAYAIAGFVADSLGTRRSMALFVTWWSLAEAATAFVTNSFSLGLARFCLGLGEPGLWVVAPKAVGEYVAPRKRALAIGLYSMGATIGAVIALPVIAFTTTHLPWRSIFLLDGAAGLLWLPLWFWCCRAKRTTLVPGPQAASPVGRSAATVAADRSNLRAVMTRPATWKLLVARGLTDPVWYFYLFWFPKYLVTSRHLTLDAIAHVAWLVYLGAGIGTVSGGLFSGYLIRRGMRIGIAYRWTMLASALVVPFSPLISIVSDSTSAILLASLIAFAHMNCLVTLTALVVELYPATQVGKAAGIIASGSGLGGMVSSEVIGYVVTHYGYSPLFFIMAVLHPLAILLVWRVFAERKTGNPAIG